MRPAGEQQSSHFGCTLAIQGPALLLSGHILWVEAGLCFWLACTKVSANFVLGVLQVLSGRFATASTAPEIVIFLQDLCLL